MNKILMGKESGMSSIVPARAGEVRGWQRWAPYAAIGWSLFYGALGVYWRIGGRGFPYFPETVSNAMGPLLGRFGTVVGWIVVMMAGIPAVAMGVSMLRGIRGRVLRPLLITSGVLLAGVLLLLMTSLNMLVLFGYIPNTVFGLFTGSEASRRILEAWTQWQTIHELLCLIGGFLWLAATICYARRSLGACLYCGRQEGAQDWTSPNQAARWGRIAVYVAMIAPAFYSFTRFAWALGFPLGMSEEHLRTGQESGTWISGLFLASFGVVGVILMFGLVQRWGEVFPRWMIGLGGRQVPVAVAVIPASLVSVLLIVGGVGIWSGLQQMIADLSASGVNEKEIIGQILFVLGPTLLFPVWGTALAVATLGYYYRRRGPCSVCGRGSNLPVSPSGRSAKGQPNA